MGKLVVSFPLFKEKKSDSLEELSEEFFRWMEHYHSLKEIWECGINDASSKIQELSSSSQEQRPYSAFRDISKRRLQIMITEYLDKIKNT